MGLVYAPFTAEQVANLNEFQTAGFVHPFTCGGNRTDEHHKDGQGVLVATEAGWHCPYCPYTQQIAHDFMADGSMVKSLREQIFDQFPQSEE